MSNRKRLEKLVTIILYWFMTSKTHEAGAFGALLTGYAYLRPTMSLVTIVTALIANLVGSLLPDIDQNSNRLWDMIPGGNFIGKYMKKVFLGHRSLSHSLLGMFLVYEGSVWLIPKLFNHDFVNTGIVILALLIGYGSHLLLDSLTEEGLPLLFPLKYKFGFPPFKKLRMRTGHFMEKWIVFPLLVLYSIGLSGWLVKIKLKLY